MTEETSQVATFNHSNEHPVHLRPTLKEALKYKYQSKKSNDPTTDANATVNKFYIEPVSGKQLILNNSNSKRSKHGNTSSLPSIGGPRIERFEEWTMLNSPELPAIAVTAQKEKLKEEPLKEETPKQNEERAQDIKQPQLSFVRKTLIDESIPLSKLPISSSTPALNSIKNMSRVSSASSVKSSSSVILKKNTSSKKLPSLPVSRNGSIMGIRNESNKESTQTEQPVNPQVKTEEIEQETLKEEEEEVFLSPATENSIKTITFINNELNKESNRRILKHKVSSLQQHFYTYIKDGDSSFAKSNSYYFIHQASVEEAVNIEMALFDQLLYIICLHIPLLRTKFYRNELIIDGDVECQIEHYKSYETWIRAYLWKEGGNDPSINSRHLQSLCQVGSSDPDGSSESIDDDNQQSFFTLESVLQSIQSKINTMKPDQDLIKLWVYPVDDSVSSGKFIFVLTMSLFVADELTCSWLFSFIMKMYREISIFESRRYDVMSNHVEKALKSCGIKDIDHENMIDYSYPLYSMNECHYQLPVLETNSFWRSILVEKSQDLVVDQHIIENNVNKLKNSLASLVSLRDSALKRKTILQKELDDCISQRKKIDFINVQGIEEEEMDDSVKVELMKLMLKEEFGKYDLVEVLLLQGISPDVISALQIKNMSLLVFSQLKDDDQAMSDAKLLSKEKKKIIGVAAFLRNRFRIYLEEQSRIKFNLERKIAKTRRELQKVKEGYKRFQHDFELTEDTIIKYQQLLNPPETDYELPIARLDQYAQWMTNTSMTNILKSEWSLTNLASTYRRSHEWLIFPIESQVVSELKRFVKHWEVVQNFHSEIPISLMECLYITSFSVLIRHITGFDKSVVGLLSENGLLPSAVGPWAQISPLKVHYGSVNSTFFDSFTDVVHERLRMIAHPSPPIESLGQQLKINMELPIWLEYISPNRSKFFLSQGFTEDDILNLDQNTPNATRLWQESERTQSQYDLKWTLLDMDDQRMIMCLKYRKDIVYDQSNLKRWMEKWLSVLDCIDTKAAKKFTIASMMSRFYHSAFNSRPDLVVQGSSWDLNQ